MFFFGDPEDLATIYYDEALRGTGPRVADVSPDEMTEAELRVAVVYVRTAAQAAMDDQAEQAVVDILVDWYDAMLEALIGVDPKLRALILSNGHVYLGGYSKENIAKYKAMASAT